MEPERRSSEEHAGASTATGAGHALRGGRLGERPAPREERGTIPWSYGDDRITAMAVDPGRLYVYWEVSDEAIARARQQLGPSGNDAWLNLRVHDITGRLFDGTNAHSHIDRGVGREDREFFFDIGKPGSDAIVELGLHARDGTFVPIARWGRAAFPRREPVGWTDPEWMMVHVHTGEVVHEGGPSAPGTEGGDPTGHETQGDGYGVPEPSGQWVEWFESDDHVAVWRMHVSWEELVKSGMEFGDRSAWEAFLHESWFEGRRTINWEGPVLVSSWEAGPFAYPVEVAAPVTDFITGPTRTYQIDGRTHIVLGPWQVVIRGLDAHRSGHILARWEIHRAWVSSQGRETRSAALPSGMQAGASERMLGASETLWLGGSELRLRGASEVHYLGASERRLLGASETLYQGASQWLKRGASERRLIGASEIRLRGASEQVSRGASERLLAGASERRLAGASERLGASERRLGGASEQLGGASELYPPPPRRE
jgi:hypothetical protein